VLRIRPGSTPPQPCCVTGTAHVLRVSLYLPIVEVKGVSSDSASEGNGSAIHVISIRNLQKTRSIRQLRSWQDIYRNTALIPMDWLTVWAGNGLCSIIPPLQKEVSAT
jgi:hypothetical protein